MKFEEIFARHLAIRVKPTDSNEMLEAIDVLSLKMTGVRGEFEIRTPKTVSTIVPTDQADINALTELLSTGCATLSILSNSAKDGSAELHVLSFNGEQLEMGNLEIGIDDNALSVLKKESLDEAAKLLWGKSVFSHGGKKYFFMVAGSAADAYLE
ncbi:MAG: hypothetical protein IJS08_12910, partial [Victivallales bacterium]|nr:hypothetical protein [Victivallales bacterium]